MKPSIAPAPTERAGLHERIVRAAVDAVYSRYCSNSIAELEAVVVALIGIPVEDEDDED